MAFFYEFIENKTQKKILMHLINKLRKELLNPRNQTTLYLTYRLFKAYMKRNPEKTEMFLFLLIIYYFFQSIANILNNVIVPMYKIYSFKRENKANLNLKFDLFKKIQNLLSK